MRSFGPYWLHNCPPKQKEEVQQFLTSHGVDLNRCMYFEWKEDRSNTSIFLAHMYKIGPNDMPMIDAETQLAVEDEPIEFSHYTAHLPEVLQRALQSA